MSSRWLHNPQREGLAILAGGTSPGRYVPGDRGYNPALRGPVPGVLRDQAEISGEANQHVRNLTWAINRNEAPFRIRTAQAPDLFSDRIRLRWTNPRDFRLRAIEIVRKEGSVPLSRDDGIQVATFADVPGNLPGMQMTWDDLLVEVPGTYGYRFITYSPDGVFDDTTVDGMTVLAEVLEYEMQIDHVFASVAEGNASGEAFSRGVAPRSTTRVDLAIHTDKPVTAGAFQVRLKAGVEGSTLVVATLTLDPSSPGGGRRVGSLSLLCPVAALDLLEVDYVTSGGYTHTGGGLAQIVTQMILR